MKQLRASWEKLSARYAALTRREQALVAAALVLGPLLIGNSLFADRQWTRAAALERGISTNELSLTELQARVTVLQGQLKADPDADKKTELAALTAEGEQLDQKLRALGSVLVRPEEMNGLLQGLLARQSGLRLVSLKTLPPEGLLGGKEGAKDSEGKPVARLFDLYRHGVEIRIEGSYGDLQAWLGQLEKLPQKLLWERLDYRVVQYPRAEMRLVVYTLSSDKTWLAL
jgi:MSHA biogenesis protein MshJ